MSDPVPEREAPDWFQPDWYDPHCCDPLWMPQQVDVKAFLTEGREKEDLEAIREHHECDVDLPDHLKAYRHAKDEYERQCEKWKQEKLLIREAKWVWALRNAVHE